MDIKSALNEYKKLYVEKLKELRDDNPDLFEKFQDYLVDEEYKELLNDKELRNHFNIGKYSYYGGDGEDTYLLFLISQKIGFEETVNILSESDSYIGIDFPKFIVAEQKDVAIEGNLWSKVFEKMRSTSIIDEKIPLNNLTLENTTGKSSYNEFVRGLFADNLLVKGTLANLIIPSANNVKLKLTDQMLKGSSFITEDTKVLDLSDYDSLQVLDNSILSKVSDKIILPDSPKSDDIRILGVSETINPNLRIVRKSGLKIKCNKNITDELRKHLDTI